MLNFLFFYRFPISAAAVKWADSLSRDHEQVLHLFCSQSQMNKVSVLYGDGIKKLKKEDVNDF